MIDLNGFRFWDFLLQKKNYHNNDEGRDYGQNNKNYACRGSKTYACRN